MKFLLIIVILIMVCFLVLPEKFTLAATDYNIKLDNYNIPDKQDSEDFLEISVVTQEYHEMVKIPLSKLLFKITPSVDKDGKIISMNMSLKPELDNFYREVGNSGNSQKTVFVYPVFTQAAYGNHGFYDYYKKNCDSKMLDSSPPF